MTPRPLDLTTKCVDCGAQFDWTHLPKPVRCGSCADKIFAAWVKGQ